MIIRTFFPDFELCWPAISKPVDLGESYIHQKKALNSGNWKQYWNWKDFCHERLQTSFSKSGAFSVRWAWPPPGWCHAQFLSWFKELYIRAFQWYIICFRILVGTCSKLQKHMNKNLPVWFHPILAVCMSYKILKDHLNTFREGIADGFVIDYFHCRFNNNQGLILLIVQWK